MYAAKADFWIFLAKSAEIDLLGNITEFMLATAAVDFSREVFAEIVLTLAELLMVRATVRLIKSTETSADPVD